MNGISIAIAERRMAKHYVMRDADRYLLHVLLSPYNKDTRGALLTGPPGTGKTYFGECLGYALGGRFDGTNGKRPHNVKFNQMHAWTTNEDMHRSPNIASFANQQQETIETAWRAEWLAHLMLDVKAGKRKASDPLPEQPPITIGFAAKYTASPQEPAWIRGVLWDAAEASIKEPTVLILDEIDKCMERSEHLLLEFLESGQFTLPNGTVITSNLDNLVVLLTTNETRELHEATLRRVYRHRMEFLPPHKEAELLRAQTGVDTSISIAVVELANKIRGGGLSSPSTKELRYMLNDFQMARDEKEVRLAIMGRLIKQHDLSDGEIITQAGKLWRLIASARATKK